MMLFELFYREMLKVHRLGTGIFRMTDAIYYDQVFRYTGISIWQVDIWTTVQDVYCAIRLAEPVFTARAWVLKGLVRVFTFRWGGACVA